MKFSLIKQLFVVSLCTLILPWTGCQYVREMETLIRQQQADTLEAFVKPLAENLKEHELFRTMATRIREDETPFFAPNTETPVIIDGYRDEWITYTESPLHSPSQEERGYTLSAVNHDSLYLFVWVRDDRVSYYDPQQAAINQHDRLRLTTGSGQYHVFTSAPGSTQTFPVTSQIKGSWQEHAQGYQVELRIPLALLQQQIRIAAIDNDGGSARVLAHSSDRVATLLVPSVSLAGWLQRYNDNPWDIQIINRRGWPLIDTSGQEQEEPLQPALVTRDELQTLLLNRIYRFFLEAALPVNFAWQWPLHTTQLSSIHQRIPIETFLDTGEQRLTRWYALSRYNQSALLVIQPIEQDGHIAGYVMATQTEKAWLSFTNQALRRVMNLSLLSFVVLVLILLGYAAWLSLRIKRLKQQAEAAIHPDGTIVPFAPGTAPDELGALSQSYTDLLTRVKNYNEYLQSLTHKLAHEIRTPLAIVKSSLEMLGSVEGEAQKTYIERALSGNQRLANILNAMSESTQVEQLVQHAEFHTMDPEPLLHDMVNAYTSTYPDFRFRLECTGAPASIRGNPELIAQLLDKLVDNARDFTPVEETITITLNRTPHQVRLSVSNPGSRLPDTMHDQLFDSLISVRDNATRDEDNRDSTHLGLGLYIVRLIAQAHQGQVAAFNLPGNRGVCFQVTLPHAGADPT